MKFEKKEYDYKESILPQEKQARLNELRKAQIDRGFSPGEKEEFQILAKQEDALRKARAKLSPEEQEQYLALIAKQASGEELSPEEAEDLVRLRGM